MTSYSFAIGNENEIYQSIDITPYGENIASPAENLGFSDSLNFTNSESLIIYNSLKMNTSKISFNIYCKNGVDGFLAFKERLYKMINLNPDKSYYKLLFGVKRNNNSIRYAYVKISSMTPQHLIGNTLPIQIQLERYSWWFNSNAYVEETRIYTWNSSKNDFIHSDWNVSSLVCSEVPSPLIIELTSSVEIDCNSYGIQNFYRNGSDGDLFDVCNEVFCRNRNLSSHIISDLSAPYYSKKYNEPIFKIMEESEYYFEDDIYDAQKNDGFVFGFAPEFQTINNQNIGLVVIGGSGGYEEGTTFTEKRKFVPYFKEA